MRTTTTKLTTSFLVIIGMLILHACSDDNGVAPDPGMEPQVPVLQQVDIDNSYFQNNEPDPEAESENPDLFQPFLTAKSIVTSMKEGVQGAIELPSFFLLITSQRDPVFSDGLWEWDFTYTVAGSLIGEDQDFDVDALVTADLNEDANSVDWEFRFSGENTPFGNLENFLLMTLNTTLDNSSGSLQFFSPEAPGNPIVDLEWDVNLPESRSVSLTFAEQDEESDEMSIMNANYLEQEDEFSLTVSDDSPETPITVDWNTSTPGGSITNPAQTCIWGEDLAAECS